MTVGYHVHLEKEQCIFSAAHFITFSGHLCERLHGHNYQVFAEVPGALDENQYVIDFLALRDELQKISQELDHHMLLPTRHAEIQVTERDDEVEVRFENRRWVFPRDDCLLLPVANTTAELLARYIGQRLLDALEKRIGIRPAHLKVGVDENHGQWAVCDLQHE
ncbi:MAG: 6-pyruvoyl tetrahydrobiopterin synthase [Planctomycetaceae bacterium]|nr:6-pyruvoyl tetrahydrobiopterin synthase [Planctomycetaceae bacterium]